MSVPIFGSMKYKELVKIKKYLEKAKTTNDKKRLQRQIDFLQEEIKREEIDIDDYLAKM